MKVSVIIPTYNSVKYLPEAARSVLAQTYEDYEIIIVDDGSTDDTRAVVKELSEKNSGKIRYIHQENRGLACARNTGIRNSRGELIALLDADDQWLPEKLAHSVRAIELDKAIGLVHTNLTRVTKNGDPICTPKKNKKYVSGKNIFKHLFLRRGHIACSSVIFRKECCDKVGLFDEQLTRIGCEDRELWLRVAQHYEIYFIDEVLILYRVHDTNFSHDRKKMFEARSYVINKFCSTGKYQRLRGPAFARVYRDLGDEYLLEDDFVEAKKRYWKSISYNPLAFWPWLNLLKSISKRPLKAAQ